MALEITLSQGYRINRDWTVFPQQGLLFHRETVVKTTPTALRILVVLVVHKLTEGGFLSNAELRLRAFPGRNVRYSAVFPHIKVLREWLPPELIRYAPNRGYVLDAELESLGNIAPAVVELPDFPEPLFARASEIVRAKNLLVHARLLTILGLGGIGKTRLAVMVARQAAPQYTNGVHYVDLAPVRDLPTLAGAVAAALKVPLLAGDSPAEAIATAIEGRRILLLADTCEYLVESAGGFFVELLDKAPRLTILATSQRRFNHKLEKFLPLRGLPVPPRELTEERKGSAARIDNFGAVQLFVCRAQLADDDFVLTDDNAADVAEICRQLGGHPLSLELAGARVPYLRAVGVRRSLGQAALSILSDGPKGGVPRHMSLRGTIDWSHGLLSATLQRALRRLAIFPASFTVEGAEAVTGEGAIALLQLADYSMLRLEDGDSSEAPRYRMHEAQMLYARERLKESGEYDETAERLAKHLHDALAQAAIEWEATPDAKWQKRHGAELDNIPTALEWAFADSARDTLAVNLTGLSARLFDLSGRLTEGRRYADRALQLIGPDTPRASAARLLRFSRVLWRTEDRSRAIALLWQAAVVYREIDDRESLGTVISAIGSDCVYLGRREEAARNLAEAEELLTGSNNIKSLYVIASSLGSLALSSGDTAQAELYFSKALDYAQTSDNSFRESLSIGNLGEVDFYRGDQDRAITRARHAAEGFRAANTPLWVAWALVNLASYLLVRGDHAEARPIVHEALLLLRKQSGPMTMLCLQVWALIAILDGRTVESAKLAGWVEARFVRSGEIREFTEQCIHDMLMTNLSADITPGDVRAYGVEGSVWSMERAIEFALQHIVPPKP